MNSDRMASSRDSNSSIESSSPRRGSFTQDDDERQAPGPSRSDNTYRPIRRINQACNACRRRKSRCTGGRPCRSCRRLDELCEYPTPGNRASARRRSSASQQQQIRVTGLVGELPDLSLARGPVIAPAAEDRMTAIETRLDDISQQLRQLTELTRQICAAKIHAPGSSNPAPQVDANTFGSFIDPLPSQHWAVKLEHLIPDTTIRAIFRAYFTLAHNQPYSFFHEATFYTRYDAGLLPDHLVLAVLSHALRFSDHVPRDRSRQMSVLFANMAWKSIVHLYFQERVDADLAAVQTITLLSIFDFTAGHERHDQAWVKIGLAIRISQDLRLMIDDESLLLSYAEREERRRVFWSVYMLDRLASCARARPPGVLEASCHLSLPCDEELWRAGFPSAGIKLDDVTRNTLPEGCHPSALALVMAMTSILGRCTQCMVQNSNNNSTGTTGRRPRQAPWEQTSDYALICSELLTCEVYFEQSVAEAMDQRCRNEAGDAFDGALAGPLVFSHLLYLLCHCFLYQPVLLSERIRESNGKASHNFLARGLDSGFDAANRMIRLVRDVKAAGYHPRGSFYGYCLVVAGSILAIGVSSTKQAVRDECSTSLTSCREIIGELAELWPSCHSMRHVLDGLVKRVQRFSTLAATATFLEPLERVDRDFMWAILDYNTLCSKTDGFWDSQSGRETAPEFSANGYEFDAIQQAGDFGDIFPAFQMTGLTGVDVNVMPQNEQISFGGALL